MKRLSLQTFALLFFLQLTINAFAEPPVNGTKTDSVPAAEPESVKLVSDNSIANEQASADPSYTEPEMLECFRKAYPDVQFTCVFDEKESEYRIEAVLGKRRQTFYWCDGKMLIQNVLAEKKLFDSLFYDYMEELIEPKKYTDKDVAEINDWTSPKNRKSKGGTPQFFYDFVYDAEKRVKVETHIKRITFLGKNSNVHDRIIKPLAEIEKEIRELAKTDAEVKKFIENLKSADCYNWRIISDSKKKSSHSYGTSLDILPVGWEKKNIYWAWRRDWDKNWMKLPNEKKWMPPLKVIKIFENHGFVYGGKWVIWDNMHFEYQPEVIEYNRKKGKLK